MFARLPATSTTVAALLALAVATPAAAQALPATPTAQPAPQPSAAQPSSSVGAPASPQRQTSTPDAGVPLPPLDANGRSSGGPALPAHPHPAVPAAQGPDPVAVGRAQAQARDTKTAVEVPELGGETWRTSVESNGSLSSKRYLGVVNVHQGDQWLPVDTTLQQTADGLRGARTPSQVLFSPGGTGPVVTAVVRGHTIRMTWPRPLPAPTISGSTATYRRPRPGRTWF